MYTLIAVGLAVLTFLVLAASDTFIPMQEWVAPPGVAVWVVTVIRTGLGFLICLGVVTLPIAVAVRLFCLAMGV